MSKSNSTGDIQYAALPYRFNRVHALEVMLVTSRDTGRWLIPKGWPIHGKKPRAVARTEAFEEAGVIGKVQRKPIGTYHYAKDLSGDGERLLAVDVFALHVVEERETWPEAHERLRSWFSLDQAAALVSDGGLALIIESLAHASPPLAHKRRTS